jgi:tRNA A-37 threonylcarbamoyl transferase component Bud32/predicted nucleotidyltransferase
LNQLRKIVGVGLLFLSEAMKNTIIKISEETLPDHRIISLCLYGSQASGYARKDSDIDILLIVDDYSPGVRYHYQSSETHEFAILAVDQRAFKADAQNGNLGDFVAGRLLTPFIPLINAEYLYSMEFLIKRRFAEEDLEDLIIEYGELARGLLVKPDFLILTRMVKRSRAYPPLKYSYINMLRSDLKQQNMMIILHRYDRVIDDLKKSRIAKVNNGFLSLNNYFIDKVLSYKILHKVVNLMDFSKRTVYSYITHGKAGRVGIDVIAKELASKVKREISTTITHQQLEDPKRYLYLKTERGLQNLNERDAIIERVSQIRKNKEIEVRPLAGALNEVYLITVESEQLVAKKYTDWYNLKWFLLNIVTYGTKLFHLSGKTRLSNEYVTNRLLAENDLPVPEIISISLEDRILIEQYIKGNSMNELVTNSFKSNQLSETHRDLAYNIGCLIAQIHELNIAMGDCKPENFIEGHDGKIYVVDLEQGERYGDKGWDIAEFLYFAGHFGTTATKSFQQFLTAFLTGYTSTGDRAVLRKAAELRYARIFFPWTPMPIIQSTSMILKKFVAGQLV